MRLASRINRIEQEIAPPVRTILIKPQLDDRDPPEWGIGPMPEGRGYVLCVPHEFVTAPESGLNQEQREFIRPTDKIIVVCRKAEGEL